MKFLPALLILALLLTACGATTVSPTATDPTPAPSLTVSSRPSATLPPAATAMPSPAPGKVVLVAPPEAESARTALAALASQARLGFEARASLAAAELKPEMKVVVFLQAPADLDALLAAAPKTQFVVVGDLEAKGNLSAIRSREELRTFLAGYITTLSAPDWRAAGLLSDAPGLLDAFLNGGRYWCGRCIPMYAPVVLFPLGAALPASTAAAGWQAAVTQMQKSILQAVYVSPEAYSPDLLKALAEQKLILVGTTAPTADAKARWAATLSFDPLPALQKLWPDLVAGKGGLSSDASLAWTDVNETYFTAGKQRLAQQVLEGLLDGTIYPFSVPLQ